MMSVADTSLERRYWCQNRLVAGVDEVGRGALAGPVVACAVILNPKQVPTGVTDSKALTARNRGILNDVIQQMAVAHSVAFVPHDRVDFVNVLQATFDAMHAAIDALHPKPQHLLIDGNRFRPHAIAHTTVVHGDARSTSIAAASIVAKVARDAWMCTVAHVKWPMYGFDKHKGYGTAQHRLALRDHGPCEIHRRTFLRL